MTFDVFRDRLYWKTTKLELSPASSIFNGTIPGAAPSLVSAWAWLPARRHGLPEKEPGELGTTGWAWGTLKSCRNIRGDAQIFFIFPRGFFRKAGFASWSDSSCCHLGNWQAGKRLKGQGFVSDRYIRLPENYPVSSTVNPKFAISPCFKNPKTPG